MRIDAKVAVVMGAILSLGLSSCSDEAEQSQTEATDAVQEADNAPTAADNSETGLTIYQAAVASLTRPEADRERDATRKPGEILEFFELAPGMRVVDLNSGGGYYTRIIAELIGSEGSVVAHNTARRTPPERVLELEEQYAVYGNVDVVVAPVETFDLPDNSADRVFLFLAYHHWHYDAEEGEVSPAANGVRLANVLRMLKPGGVLGIIEHRSTDDASREASNEIHRIPAPVMVADLTAAGFIFAGESDLLSDFPEDDVTKYWRENTERGHTRRLVHIYRKPADTK